MNLYCIVHASAQKWLTEKRQTRLTTIVSQKSHTCHIASSLLQHVLKMFSFSANASGKRWHHSQTADSTTCISQGSVATVLKWGSQKYSHFCRVSSWCCTPKIIKIDHCCTELFKEWKWYIFYESRCSRSKQPAHGRLARWALQCTHTTP